MFVKKSNFIGPTLLCSQENKWTEQKYKTKPIQKQFDKYSSYSSFFPRKYSLLNP